MKCLADRLVKHVSPSNISWNNHVITWNRDTNIITPSRLTIAIFLVISNTMMMVGMCKTKNKKMSIPKKMYFSSAICGLVTGLTLPFYTLSMLRENQGCIYEHISDLILNFTAFLDYGKLMSIGVTRFISLKWPFRTLVTGKTLFSIWLFEIIAATSSTALMFGFIGHQSDPITIFKIFSKVFGFTSGACIILTAILTLILWISFRMEQGFISNDGHQEINKRKNKAVVRLIVTASAYIICNIPLCLMCFIVNGTSEKGYIKDPMLLSRRLLMINWFFSIVSLYSGLNSCIYMWMDKKIVLFYRTCGRNIINNRSFKVNTSNNLETFQLEIKRTRASSTVSNIWDEDKDDEIKRYP